MEKYDKWLAREEVNQEFSGGNLKPPPRRVVINWIVEA